jgi:hypothetical protein
VTEAVRALQNEQKEVLNVSKIELDEDKETIRSLHLQSRGMALSCINSRL